MNSKNDFGLIKFVEKGRLNNHEMQNIKGGAQCGSYLNCHEQGKNYCTGGFSSWFKGDCEIRYAF